METKLDRHNIVGYCVLFVVMFLIGLAAWVTWLSVKPNSDFSFEKPFEVISEETTSDGIPVVRVSDPLLLEISFCNFGVNTETRRFMDLHGMLPDSDELVALGAFELDPVQTFSGTIDRNVGCLEVEQPVNLPDSLDADVFYKFRNDTSWRVNAIRVDSEEESSELFYYASDDAVLP